MKKLWGHFCTITRHKWIVMKLCFACGYYKQGIFLNTHGLNFLPVFDIIAAFAVPTE